MQPDGMSINCVYADNEFDFLVAFYDNCNRVTRCFADKPVVVSQFAEKKRTL